MDKAIKSRYKANTKARQIKDIENELISLIPSWVVDHILTKEEEIYYKEMIRMTKTCTKCKVEKELNEDNYVAVNAIQKTLRSEMELS